VHYVLYGLVAWSENYRQCYCTASSFDFCYIFSKHFTKNIKLTFFGRKLKKKDKMKDSIHQSSHLITPLPTSTFNEKYILHICLLAVTGDCNVKTKNKLNKHCWMCLLDGYEYEFLYSFSHFR